VTEFDTLWIILGAAALSLSASLLASHERLVATKRFDVMHAEE
jgi:hypothetical protein